MAGTYEPYSDSEATDIKTASHKDDGAIYYGRIELVDNRTMLFSQTMLFFVMLLSIAICTCVIINAVSLATLQTTLENSLLVSGRECVHEAYIKKRHCSLISTPNGQFMRIPCAEIEELVQAFAAATGNITLMIQATAAQKNGRSLSVETQNIHTGSVICRGWDLESREDTLVGLKYCLPLREPRDFACGHVPI